MDLLIIVLMMLLGIVTGGLLGLAMPGDELEVVVFAASLGALLGTVIAYGIVSWARKSTHRPSRGSSRGRPYPDRTVVSPRERPPRTPSAPFRTRLAHFAGKQEQEVMTGSDGWKSAMPFWSLANAWSHVPPKPAAAIRRTLLAIRRILRG